MSSFDEIPDELIEYIEVKGSGYFVKKASVDGGNTFGKFNSLKEACAAACILYRNNWRLMDVIMDPLVNYGGEFWVFKVEENKLIFDDKFEEYETAVEYIEINSRCNDYHNDIFKNSLKKEGRKGRLKSIKMSDDLSNEDNIFEKEGLFIVKQSKRSKVVFGEFDDYDEANAAKKILVDKKWNISGEHEIVFFKEYYWVFDVIGGFLIFKGKSQSYEDAFDLTYLPTTQRKLNKSDIMSMGEDIDDVVKKRKLKSKTSNNSKSSKKGARTKNVVSKSSKNDVANGRVISKYDNSKYINIKTSDTYFSRIWSAKLETNAIEKKQIRIFVERCGDNVNDLFSILDFTFLWGKVDKCIVDGVEIDWDKRYDVHFSNFPEFELIIKILEINKWDLSKISMSSSIYFYDNYFYKVHIVDNTIVFAKFINYKLAENNILIYKGRPIISDGCYHFGIERRGDYFELIKFQKGEFYKTLPLKSLEETKAIRDILIHANWNFRIFDKFDKFDLFYLNGFYWELKCNNRLVSLINRYELLK